MSGRIGMSHPRAAVGLLVAVVACGCAAPTRSSAAAAVVQILTPPAGLKVRKGQTLPVTVEVRGSAGLSWRLSLSGAGDATTPLANGAGPVSEATVAELQTDLLNGGEPYTLTLEAMDAAVSATATSTFTIPDPEYTLIPLETGNLSKRGYSTYAVDGPGKQVLYSSATGDPAPLTVIHRDTGKRDLLLVPLGSTEGVQFSGDGARLLFKGDFPGGFGLGYLGLNSGSSSLISERTSFFFSADETGGRVAYQGGATDNTTQYFLFDETMQERRQLTTDPGAIQFTRDCPGQFGTTPQITADGATVVLITAATLGIVPEDPAVGCRVFSYDAAAQSLRQVAALPSTLLRVDIPALSGDGRWLSFPLFSAERQRSLPALLDMQSGVLSAPVVDVGTFTSFDSAVTRDGRGIIISTEADLDPRVGNADHNLELFYYDRTNRRATQITETIGGIGRTPGGCESYRTSASANGAVMAFAFQRISLESCMLDGPQRNEADGFAFGFVRAVRNRPGNVGVVLSPLPDPRVVAGETLKMDIIAQDADGDPISFFAQAKDGEDVPPGSTITDHYDGTATFEWVTKPEDAGDHVLRVAAFDEGGGEMFQDVMISVVPAGQLPCAGSCNGDNSVSVDEIVVLVRIALGQVPVQQCTAGDTDGNGVITVDEVLRAVTNALNGCSA
jgi:hypothetical protein